MKQTFVLLLTLLFPALLLSQEVETGITGRVIGSESKQPGSRSHCDSEWRKQAD